MPPPEPRLVGLGLEAVDVADEYAGWGPGLAVTDHDADVVRQRRVAAQLVVQSVPIGGSTGSAAWAGPPVGATRASGPGRGRAWRLRAPSSRGSTPRTQQTLAQYASGGGAREARAPPARSPARPGAGPSQPGRRRPPSRQGPSSAVLDRGRWADTSSRTWSAGAWTRTLAEMADGAAETGLLDVRRRVRVLALAETPGRRLHRAHPVEPEGAPVLAVDVPGHQVPPPAGGDQADRLDVARARRRRGRRSRSGPARGRGSPGQGQQRLAVDGRPGPGQGAVASWIARTSPRSRGGITWSSLARVRSAASLRPATVPPAASRRRDRDRHRLVVVEQQRRQRAAARRAGSRRRRPGAAFTG